MLALPDDHPPLRPLCPGVKRPPRKHHVSFRGLVEYARAYCGADQLLIRTVDEADGLPIFFSLISTFIGLKYLALPEEHLVRTSCLP